LGRRVTIVDTGGLLGENEAKKDEIGANIRLQALIGNLKSFPFLD
jgi:hypothetical protein